MNVRAISFGVIGLLLVAACANDPYGNLASPSNEAVQPTNGFPAVVEVILPQGLGLCSGTFIGPSVVLTADHCTSQTGSYEVITSFGVFNTYNVVRFGTGDVTDTEDLALLIFDHNIADPAQGQVYNIGSAPSVLDVVEIVGFGCNDLGAQTGTGQKRAGTNQVYQIDNYIELVTPQMPNTQSTQNNSQVQRILGPSNRAGSCFGDSGGPMLKRVGNGYQVVGITHAGGTQGSVIISQYINLNQSDNLGFLTSSDSQYNLGIFGCSSSSIDCNVQSAAVQIVNFMKIVWGKLMSWFF